MGDVHFVLIGEASHGTDEFYRHRADITKRLIEEKGFHAVAAEADWPDAHRVNRYVRGSGTDDTAEEALSGFSRFPAWMWSNDVVAEFISWLRTYNTRSDIFHQAGFYGLDLYSLNRSRAEVVHYLEKVDPAAATRARQRYGCFDHFGEDEQAYGFATGFGVSDSCEQEVVQQLVDLQRRTYEYMHRDGHMAEDEFFSAEQNATVVRNAEEYRAMFRGRVSTWNLRDRHMAETLHALSARLDRRLGHCKIVVWAHNSHLGDARATQMGRRGEWNLGQLVRERYPQNSFLLGFTTYSGTVTASNDWGDPPLTMQIRPALPDTYEALFHAANSPAFLIHFAGESQLSSELRRERLERAIGVVYRPETERLSHYFYATLPDQFDAILHIDRTRALQPLKRFAEPDPEEVPETFPSGV
jgi:erythromycin esterase-like protein